MIQLTPLQLVLLDELKWFDGFCTDHGLTYYAIGGTLLGAMRHNGFIPWDDDIDLGMPRVDYDKLEEYSGIDGQYMIETCHSKRKDFCYPFSKLYDTRTTLVEHKRVNISRGVFIDIFPIDGIGDTLEESYKNFRSISRLYHFYLSIVAGVRKGRSFQKNLAVFLSRMIPFSFNLQGKVRKALNAKCSFRVNQPARYGGNLLGAYGKNEIVEMALFGVPQRHQFEDTMINCPADADGYLSRIYHDWHSLPPIEKRISHHDFVSIDLDRPFISE